VQALDSPPAASFQGVSKSGATCIRLSVLNTSRGLPHVNLHLVKRRQLSTRVAKVRTSEVEAFPDLTGIVEATVDYAPGDVIFAQGDIAKKVMYIQSGGVRLSVQSKAGRDAVLAMLGPGDFFGEGCLAGQRFRIGTATAIMPSAILPIGCDTMSHLLHDKPAISDRFIAHILARTIRIEEDLIDHLFNSSEKRLARALLLLADYGKQARLVPKISQKTLAEMVGMTRPRVNFFLNKFRALGFIEYNGELKVHRSLLIGVLRD
jgi:CRP/FNR family cyclic AMP-dependent transcriptional regulator